MFEIAIDAVLLASRRLVKYTRRDFDGSNLAPCLASIVPPFPRLASISLHSHRLIAPARRMLYRQ